MPDQQYSDAGTWALSVSRDEPHGLDELQRQLRRTAPQVIERAAVPPGRKVLHVLYLLLSACALIGPIAAFTASLDMSEAPTRSYDFDPEFEIKVALIGFAFGIFFQGRMLYRWWHEGHHRDSAAIVLSTLILLCAAGTVLQAYAVAEGHTVYVTLHLLPAFVTGIGAVVTIVLCAAAPPAPDTGPADDRQDAQERPEPEVDLTALQGAARAAVLKDRRKALTNLADRGLLEGHDVDELMARPLGQLVDPDAGPTD